MNAFANRATNAFFESFNAKSRSSELLSVG
nr:hypothetical protein [uncultured Prevotella sp.]